jgi:RimJ/RimL family protein N-acetyltransferase
MSDGVVEIRPPGPGDAATIVAGRDEVSRRFLGDGVADPRPTACIVVDGEVVGWVDHENHSAWLEPGEVNVGYGVFPQHRGNGYAARALALLLHHLAVASDHRVATLVIERDNLASLAVARRTGFTRVADREGHPYFKRPLVVDG